MPSQRELHRSIKLGLTCKCPERCKYCGAKRKLDSVGHRCPTKNCQWQHGYKGCDLFKSHATVDRKRADS